MFQRRGQTLLLAYLAARKTQEIGIRMGLGASPRDVLLAVAGQGVGLSAAGQGGADSGVAGGVGLPIRGEAGASPRLAPALMRSSLCGCTSRGS